jgi:hypothetical protein
MPMNRQYRVCLIVPKGYPHASCFVETAMLLKYSITSLGMECDIALNSAAPDRTTIVLGYHLPGAIQLLEGCRYIPYQLEQFSQSQGTWNEQVTAVLRGAVQIWDYSHDNIAFLQQHGLDAKYLPLGYHPCLERITPAPNKDIDVLLYGSSNPRREAVLHDLRSTNDISVKHLFGVYGQERDVWISRSRIILNVHFYETKLFESVRVSYLVNNRCFVLCETSQGYPYEGVRLPFAEYADIASQCRQLLSQKQDVLDTTAYDLYQSLKNNYPMTAILSTVLDN